MPHVGGDEPRTDAERLAGVYSMPHVGGDEPTNNYNAITTATYAPRMWG